MYPNQINWRTIYHLIWHSTLDQYKEAGGKLPSSDAMLEFLKAYQRGFKILDDYDHHTLEVPEGQKDVYVIQYYECIKLIHNTMFVD